MGKYLSEQFQVPERTAVVVIYRIHLADEKPVVIAKSLFRTLRENYGVSYSMAKDTINACNASFEEAQLLSIQPNSALITVKMICYIDDVVSEHDMSL